ncbi:helix-turn-helix domain-containing protein [Streptomyces sp. NBC_00144]|uniref:helix-turn-helix domain-containing protein n=1 Tax=unclassified Streptomyces TaxID=2593676 RepID=UPI0032521B12
MNYHNPDVRQTALSLLRSGVRNRDVARQLSVPCGTIGWWRHQDRKLRGEAYVPSTDCPRCTYRDFDHAAYAYLLGLYLGDGHIVSKPKQRRLSVYCGDDWPGLIHEAEKAMRTVMATPSVARRQKKGCTEVMSFSTHWICLFPQHGPGKKHDRTIALEPWQQQIVDEYPWPFVRGLIHSDGCRNTNWTTRIVGGERKRYEYPRYWFTNVSDDIRRLYTDTLDKLGVEWKSCTRHSRPYNISVAKRGSVALMDAHVGPKY